jgi:hypothetical protein
MRKKHEIITFKVDGDLWRAIKDLPNRSEFIRTALLAAVGSMCPLCNGTGVLTPNQTRHWHDFASHHSIQKCSDCEELVLVCSKTSEHDS